MATINREKYDSRLPAEILSNSINPASHVQNIGVTFDADLNFKRQINNIVKSCNFTISMTSPASVSHLSHLSQHATVSLALVSKRLLHSVPITYLDKLQGVQNPLARVVTKSPIG